MTRLFLTPEVREVALSLMAGLNSPRSLTVAILIRHEEWVQLLNLQCSPSDYCSAEDYLRAAGATDFLRKYDVPLPEIDPEAASLQKWWDAEKQCFNTNRRLYEIMDFGTLSGLPVHDGIISFIETCRKNVMQLVGSGPNPTFEGRFGPGATMSDTSQRTTILHKMSSTPTLTPSALPYLFPWTGTKWAAAVAARGDDINVIRGNSYFPVPKTALTHRACAKEPSINGFYQLGLGRELKDRLKSAGLDLRREGQYVHRRVACAASKTGEYCTIDLSSASDTVCRALVKLLLPPRWFNHLDDLRSPMTRVKGSWVRLEKFSSMGNGFTFELETVIFSALCMTCMGEAARLGRNLWVYGDDIIVPTQFARDVTWALKFFGFTPNERKTFTTGPFRESCGGDFYDGWPVRPHYLKEQPNEPQQYISLANGIRRLAQNLGPDSRLCHDLRRSWFKCLDFIPSTIRQCRGPVELGDLVIHDDESRWNTRWRANGIRYIRVYRPASFRGVSFARFDPTIQIAAALYGVMLNPVKPNDKWPDGFDNRIAHIRDGVQGYKVGWVPYS